LMVVVISKGLCIPECVREEGEDISPSNHPHQNKKKKKETTNKREKQQGFHKKYLWMEEEAFLLGDASKKITHVLSVYLKQVIEVTGRSYGLLTRAGPNSVGLPLQASWPTPEDSQM